jgi:hypothetical protein
MTRFLARTLVFSLNSLGFNNLLSNLLPRFAALLAIFAILIPTLFIIPAPKVSAKETAPSYVAASPEAFVIGSNIGTFESVASSVSGDCDKFCVAVFGRGKTSGWIGKCD